VGWQGIPGIPKQGSLWRDKSVPSATPSKRVQASSPNPAAPAFETIANVPGMTAVALAAALQSSHQTMPNVMLDANQRTDITAYILSLRRGN